MQTPVTDVGDFAVRPFQRHHAGITAAATTLRAEWARWAAVRLIRHSSFFAGRLIGPPSTRIGLVVSRRRLLLTDAPDTPVQLCEADLEFLKSAALFSGEFEKGLNLGPVT
jgi:hypothetical protein